MGLGVYVMPIWKFKAGDFASPLEALGVAPVIIGPGITQRDRDARPRFITRWKAKPETRSLRREITRYDRRRAGDQVDQVVRVPSEFHAARGNDPRSGERRAQQDLR